MKNQKLIIWVLLDDRTGHNNQSLGVAQALKLPYQEKHIEYNCLGRLPNIIKRKSLIGIKDIFKNTQEWPDLVIATGRRLAPISLYIKKKSLGKTKICQMMWSAGNVEDFDLLAVPEHDNRKGKNIIATIGAPNMVTLGRLMQEKSKFLELNRSVKHPVITVLIGGKSKKGEITSEMITQLILEINHLVKKLGGKALISTSRRTPAHIIELIKQKITIDYDLYDPNSNDSNNPYLAYLALADVIVVTGDSVSMCTEACTTQKPVFIYSPDGLAGQKHQSMHQSLYKNKHARAFSELKNWQGIQSDSIVTPLNEAQRIAAILKGIIS